MRKIIVVTGTRAEFGLLKPLIQAIDKEPDFELQLIVAAMHLSPEFGNTIDEIHKYNFKISKKIECLLSSDSHIGVSKSTALALSSFSEAFDELQPDIIVLLGDRSEILAAAIAASFANIPIAHLHGGETTEGAYDEGIRHAITKFSSIHFAATEIYRKRIIQLGERPQTVFNVGAIGLDNCRTIDYLSQSEIEDFIGKKLKKRNFLITYHPVTLEKNTSEKNFQNLLSALDKFDDTLLIFTHANSDKEGRKINQMIKNYVANNSEKAVDFQSLGMIRYLSLLKLVDVVIGNSSSGILEVPFFNIPTINIGDRQKGRLSPQSVIHVEENENDIFNAITKSLENAFLERCKTQENLFGDGKATEKIMEVLKNFHFKELKKKFYDIEFNYE